MTALTVAQVCEALRITRRQFARLVRTGQLAVCVREEDLAGFIECSRVRSRKTP